MLNRGYISVTLLFGIIVYALYSFKFGAVNMLFEALKHTPSSIEMAGKSYISRELYTATLQTQFEFGAMAALLALVILNAAWRLLEMGQRARETARRDPLDLLRP